MKRLLGAAAAVFALACAGSASAASWLVDLNSYTLGSTLDFRTLAPHPSILGGGTIVEDPRGGGRAVLITPGPGTTPAPWILSRHTAFYCEPTFPCWWYQADMTFDIYAPNGATLQTQGPKIILAAGEERSNWRAGSGLSIMYTPVYLTNLYVTDGWSPTPEPTTWAMMIIGFGGVGGMLRGAKRSASDRPASLLA